MDFNLAKDLFIAKISPNLSLIASTHGDQIISGLIHHLTETAFDKTKVEQDQEKKNVFYVSKVKKHDSEEKEKVIVAKLEVEKSPNAFEEKVQDVIDQIDEDMEIDSNL